MERKVKLFCSFGGELLRRPIDRTLRYVGGETRIIRISKGTSWQQLKQMTMEIYNQPHTIKYQHPGLGEDLDALVLMSCDEDVEDMMECCSVLEGGDDKKPLIRMFLCSLKDSGTVCSGQLLNVNVEFEQNNERRVSVRIVASGPSGCETFMLDLGRGDGANHANLVQGGVLSKGVSLVDQDHAVYSPLLKVGPVENEGADLGHMDSQVDVGEEVQQESSSTIEEGAHVSHTSQAAHPHLVEKVGESLEVKNSVPKVEENLGSIVSEYESFATGLVNGGIIDTNVGEIDLSNIQLPLGVEVEQKNPDRDAVERLASWSAGYEGYSTDHSYTDPPSHSTSVKSEWNHAFSSSGDGKYIASELLPGGRTSASQPTSIGASVSLIDQAHVGNLALLKVDEGVPRPNVSNRSQKERARLGHLDSLVDFGDRAQPKSSRTIEDDAHVLHPSLVGRSFEAKKPLPSMKETLGAAFSDDEEVSSEEDDGSIVDNLVGKINLSNFQIIKSEDLTELKEVGSCSFHSVYQGMWKDMDVAIKRIKKSCSIGVSTKQERLESLREAGILSRLDHPNVVNFYGVVPADEAKPIAIVMEFMVNGSLKDVLLHMDGYLDHCKKLIIALDVAIGMEYLHRENIIHFGLKCKNLLVDLKDPLRPIVKVGGFGQSQIKPPTLASRDVRGTLPWMAPELIEGGSSMVSEKVDVYSFGIVMWELLTGEEPYVNMNDDAIKDGIMANTLRPPVPVSCDPEWRRLMEQCWASDPQQRPSFIQIASQLCSMYMASQAYRESIGEVVKEKDIKKMKELGSGTFGAVYLGEWRGFEVAIKRINKSCFTAQSSEHERLILETWREAEILSKFHHPNVVSFYGVMQNEATGTISIVTEFVVNGSLRNVLLHNRKYLDNWKQLIIVMGAASGMEYLHLKNIIHFDLKCDNLLVDLKDPSRPICKIGDLGLSKIKRKALVSGGIRGTLQWMAPEIIRGSNMLSEKVDVYSFGIVMWEILTGEVPYANMNEDAIKDGVANNKLRPPVPASFNPAWKKLMEQCWDSNPQQRPSFSQIAHQLRSMSVAIPTYREIKIIRNEKMRNQKIIKNEDLEELRQLGAGAFGTVYHGKWRGVDVAIKYFADLSFQQERLVLCLGLLCLILLALRPLGLRWMII